MEKLNLLPILKDCPKGMELNCTMFYNVKFDYIKKESDNCPIRCFIESENGHNAILFTKYGEYCTDANSKCVIFPKGKTTWEGFQRPFKEGDIVATDSGLWLGIIKYKCNNSDVYEVHCAWCSEMKPEFFTKGYYRFSRLATEAEKSKLFKIIKDNGYRWDEEKETLEKLIEPKFKVGDIIQAEDSYQVKITEVNIDDECYGYESMIAKGLGGIAFNEQDEWELVPNKFDINTLKPFDKVLVRNELWENWRAEYFSHFNNKYSTYICTKGAYCFCIPYEGNEHLIGTTDVCDEYYRTWKK